MTQTDPRYDEGSFDRQVDEETQAMRNAREAAERNAETATQAQAEATQLKRENAMLRALPGVDMTSPLAEMFVRSYQGELDGEAIKAAAQAVGVLPKTEDTTPPPPPAEDQQLSAERQALQTGATFTPPNEQQHREAQDPYDNAMAAFNADLGAGRTREAAAAAYFDHVIGAAVHGDERVQWRGWTPEQLGDSQ